MPEKQQSIFATKRARITYQMENPPKICTSCLTSLSKLEKSEGVFVDWCFNCNIEYPRPDKPD